MTKEQKQQIINRFKSFGWRAGMMIVAGLLDVLLQSLTDFNLNDGATLIIGLVLAEISKYINKNYL